VSWESLNLAALGEQPPPDPSIGGIAYPGKRTLLSGEPEALKSWFAAIILREQIRAGRNVAIVDFEQGPDVTVARLKDLGVTRAELEQVIYIEPREPLTETGRNDLRDMLHRDRPSVAVFDAYAGLIGLNGGNPNAESDIEAVNRQVVDVFRASGAAAIMLDHVVKNSAERGRYSSGSGRKLGEVDVHIRLDRGAPFGRGRTGTARLVVLKDRLGGIVRTGRTLTMTSDPETGQVTGQLAVTADGSDPRFEPTGYMEKVSRFLEKQAEPVTRNTVETAVKGRAEYVRLAMDELVARGDALETTGASRSRLIETAHPYRENAT
jgi:hypothetical protein